jgi:hypothetical protein
MLTNITRLAAVLAACASIFVSAGCRTTGTQRAEMAAQSLGDLQAEIKTAGEKLNVSVVALNELVKNPQSDLKPQYDAFTKSMDALEGQINSVKSRSETMKARGKEYFAAWEESSKSLSSPEMKEYSEERRAKLNETYEAIKANVARIAEVGKPLMDSLRDTRKFLSFDLTANGIAAATPTAEKANADAATLKTELEKLMKEIDDVAKILAPNAKTKDK